MIRKLTTLLDGESGAVAAEYAVLAALIAVVIAGAVYAVGLATNDLFTPLVNRF